MAAGDRDAPAGGDDRRAGELPGLDRVAQGEDQARIVAEVAHRGEAGEQRAAGVEQGGIGLVLIVADGRLQPRLQPVVEAAQVDVHVDQAGQDGVVRRSTTRAPGTSTKPSRISAIRCPRTTMLTLRRGAWPGTASSVPAWITVTGSAGCAAAGTGLGESGSGQRDRQRGERVANNLHRHPLD